MVVSSALINLQTKSTDNTKAQKYAHKLKSSYLSIDYRYLYTFLKKFIKIKGKVLYLIPNGSICIHNNKATVQMFKTNIYP